MAHAFSLLVTNAQTKIQNKIDNDEPVSDAALQLVRRQFKLYDPGARVISYVQKNHQMMDMYFGIENGMFRLRKPIIAEFIHYAMGYDQMGVPFDRNMSGMDAYRRAFGANAEGWKESADNVKYYGQSATKEISKIIREAIQRWGGRLIFEGQGVYGANVFDLQNGRDTDTALELRSILPNFVAAAGPIAPFGNGFVKFHWGGEPTRPTRAHFLTNWNWNRKYTHTIHNRVLSSHLERMLSPNHGLSQLWNGLPNFPAGLLQQVATIPGIQRLGGNATTSDQMRGAIALLTAAITERVGLRTPRPFKMPDPAALQPNPVV
ncbi:hypothetical protein [Yoonia sp. 2307UL14-13]|uniref:hypothetical protein n=1 Tax=Yoonia sp. 2307UL14-13 TaxID=3126506 RepID=UPI0030A772FD